jgi:hypothetical protein
LEIKNRDLADLVADLKQGLLSQLTGDFVVERESSFRNRQSVSASTAPASGTRIECRRGNALPFNDLQDQFTDSALGCGEPRPFERRRLIQPAKTNFVPQFYERAGLEPFRLLWNREARLPAIQIILDESGSASSQDKPVSVVRDVRSL